MPITINGTGSITGLSAGGLPDGCVTAPELDGAQTGSDPVYGARAWVNFNGTGTNSTNQTIRASGNVSSVFKNGSGDYTVNFTTAMSSANYVAVVTGVNTASANANVIACGLYAPTTAGIGTASVTTGSVRITSRTSSGNQIDCDVMSVAIFL